MKTNLIDAIKILASYGRLTITPFVEENEEDAQYKINVWYELGRFSRSYRCTGSNMVDVLTEAAKKA